MKPARLTMNWSGDPPTPGLFLKSERGRRAYEIGTVRKINTRDGSAKFALTCARWEAKEVPDHATVITIQWHKRGKRR